MKIDQKLLDIEVIRKSKLPLIDLFIRRTSVITSTPEYLVEKIIKDQWQHANKQTQPLSTIGEIDFCNLGTFFISKNKAAKRLTRLEKFNEDILGDEKRKNNTNDSLMVHRNMESIMSIRRKTKTEKLTDECETHNGGPEE